MKFMSFDDSTSSKIEDVFNTISLSGRELSGREIE